MNSSTTPQHDAAPGMTWGIKTSFLRYLSRTPDGLSSVTDGADLTEDGVYKYRFSSQNSREVSTLRFEGSVRFSAHAGQLKIGFTNPEITLAPDGATLSIVDHFATHDGARIKFAHGTVADGDTNGTNQIRIHQVRLTEEGANLFQNIYKTGEALDDIVVSL